MLEKEAYLKNVLSLAYLGDAVFTLMVREALLVKHDLKANGLNRIANSIVCAKNQADIMSKLDGLTEEELSVVNRARNSHFNNKAKNSTAQEYGMATELEALIGFWHLTGQSDKINDMFNKYVMEKL